MYVVLLFGKLKAAVAVGINVSVPQEAGFFFMHYSTMSTALHIVNSYSMAR